MDTILAAEYPLRGSGRLSNNVLHASAGLRYAGVELGVDAYNLLALHYADDEQVFVSNWSVQSATSLASTARHYVAAPPR